MKTTTSPSAGFTLLEVFITLLVVIVLLSLIVPRQRGCGDCSRFTQVVVNGKQLAFVANMMASDGDSTGDPALNWPGDLLSATGTNSNGDRHAINSLDDYLQRMINYEYIKPGDLARAMNSAGPSWNVPRWDGHGPFRTENSIWKAFKISKDDLGKTLFLTTKNYTYNMASLDPTKPLGDSDFVVARKDSSAASFTKQSTQNLHEVGLLPGSRDLANPGTESGHLLE